MTAFRAKTILLIDGSALAASTAARNSAWLDTPGAAACAGLAMSADPARDSAASAVAKRILMVLLREV